VTGQKGAVRRTRGWHLRVLAGPAGFAGLHPEWHHRVMAGPVAVPKVGRRQTTKEVKVTRREKVSFPSGTVSSAGHLFLPEPKAGTGCPPVVILAHGFSGTMDRLVP
jgi:hypothetical protein